MALGNRARLAGLNLVGLRRRGFSREAIDALQAAYRACLRLAGPCASERERFRRTHRSAEVQQLARFIAEGVDRSFCLPRKRTGDGAE